MIRRAAFALGLLFVFASPLLASAATLSLGGTKNVHVGDTFSVPVYLTTDSGESANAVSGTVTYPADKLELITISKSGTIVSLWPSEPYGQGGAASFEGVILNPGFTGVRGTVVTLTFQAISPGSAALAFSDASVLANDGNATPILNGTAPSTVTIAAPAQQTTPPAQTTTKPTQSKPQTQTQTPAQETATSTPSAIELSSTTSSEEPVVESDLLSGAYQFAVDNGPLVALGIALVLALFLLARFLLWYPFIPIGRARRVRKDVTAGLHERFDELREAVTQEVFALEHAKSKRELTAEEERFLIRFQKLLTKTERDLEKEFSNK